VGEIYRFPQGWEADRPRSWRCRGPTWLAGAAPGLRASAASAFAP